MQHFAQTRRGNSARWAADIRGWEPQQELSASVLTGPWEQRRVAALRQLADVRTEYEVDPGIEALEPAKDALGIVVGLMEGGTPVGTIRFIPSGHGLTLTERFWQHASAGTPLVAAGAWEVGRLIVAPDRRRGDLLPRYLALALVELLRHEAVEHLHASCHMRMTRLFRRFGFGIYASAVSRSGKDCALIHGHVRAVAAALDVAGAVLAPATPTRLSS